MNLKLVLFLAAIIIFLLLSYILLSIKLIRVEDDYKKNDHFDGVRFHNLVKDKERSIFDLLKWRFGSKSSKWPDFVETNSDIPPEKIEGDDVRVSFVGHATFLVQTEGINFLTDPVWSSHASPNTFVGPKRVSKPGIDFKKLPKIDFVIISHNHYDHLDLDTIEKLYYRYNPIFIVPVGNEKIITDRIKGAMVESLDWGGSYEHKPNIKISLEPAHHWSSRWAVDYNRSLWGTFIVSFSRGSICFIGDSAYNKDIFKNIGNKYSDLLLSIIPIGAYEPRWFMKKSHMNPKESVFTHLDLKSKYSIASHFGTFKLTDEAIERPVEDLNLAKKELKVEKFLDLKIGEHLNLKY